MKSTLKYLILLLSVAIATSCMKERFNNDLPCPCDDEKDVTLKLALPYAAPVTRSISADQENAITTLDVLAFKVEGGVETFQYWATATNTGGAGSMQSFRAKVRIRDYQQRFVFISNARGKIETLINSRPSEGWIGTDKEAMLGQLTFDLNSADRWNAISSTNYTAIPMWGQSDPKVISSSTTSISESPIKILRMIAKIEVQLDRSVAGLTSAFRLKSVHVYNTNTSGRIVPRPGTEYVGTDMIAKKASLPASVTNVVGPTGYTDFTPPGETDVAMRGLIYLFETAAKNAGNFLEETCIVVGGRYGSDTQDTYYRLDFFAPDGATHLDILRNHRYICNITSVNGSGLPTVDDAYRAKPFNMEAEIIAWDESQIRDIAFNDQYILGVSHNPFILSAAAQDMSSMNNILKITTDYPDGWTAEVSGSKTSITPASWLTITPYEGAGGVQLDDMRLLAEQNVNMSERTAYIHLKAGRLTYVVTVIQKGNMDSITDNDGAGTPPVEATTYVGAFWRANQTGERIIRIHAGINAANLGAWAASVVWLDKNWDNGDGVILSVDKLPGEAGADPNIYTTNPGNAESFQVEGNVSTVTGNLTTNGYITFRIGLKSEYTPTTNHPARYAVVLLSYAGNNRYQKIFLRQGEQADYLMTPDDAISIGGKIVYARPAAKKFSTRNLTWNVMDAMVLMRSAIFTDYPTKPGALFQWANTSARRRYAWNPFTVAAPSLWNTMGGGVGFWDTLAGDQEISPDGYRRPNDGSISGYEPCTTVANSEIRQSLFANPGPNYNYASETGNSIWGYYADGFFDRRQIAASPTGAANTAVSSGENVAYIGRLFFNPVAVSDRYNASLFFPAAGWRYDVGNLTATGIDATYWSASVNNDPNRAGLGLILRKESAGMWRAVESVAMSIRCVAE